MVQSRFGLETKAITEGAVMATLTVILGLTGVYLPLLSPVVMLIWTLPVVLVCMRHGMRAGVATIAVAGVVIMSLTTPITAFNMMLRSAGPGLLIGCGFHFKWRTEKTVLYASLASFAGIVADMLVSVFVMGISLQEIFFFDGDMVDELVQMFADYGLLSAQNLSPAEMAAYITEITTTMTLMVPAMLLIYSLLSALTNYLAANLVLRKLKVPLPPMTKLSTFRLPVSVVFGFLLGFGLTVVGNSFFPDIPLLVTAGQNLTIFFLVVYMIQGLGLVYFFIGKASPSMQGALRFALLALIVLTVFNALVFIGYAGVADALFDFRRLDMAPEIYKDGRKHEEGD